MFFGLNDVAFLAAVSEPVLWTPAYITTALWLDAADSLTVTADGSNLISNVNDKSGNGRSFTASGGSRPTYSASTLNSKAVFTFGGSQFLGSSNAAATWNFLHNTNGSTVICVWKAGSNSDPNALLGLCGTSTTASSNIGLALFYDDRASASRQNKIVSAINRGVSGEPTAANVSADDAMPANTAVLLSHVGDPGNATAASRSSLRINAGSAIELNTSTFAATSSDATFTLELGSVGNNSFPLTGYVAEFIVLASIASTSTRQRIEGYLAHKWGLVSNLPNDHPYKTAAPTV